MPEPGDPTGAERIVAEATGAAALRIPIASPPGPGGIAPELALTYSSRGGDGPFGVGWSLDLPEIRCSARFGVPDFGSCARYELGDALLAKSGAPKRAEQRTSGSSRLQPTPNGPSPPRLE